MNKNLIIAKQLMAIAQQLVKADADDYFSKVLKKLGVPPEDIREYDGKDNQGYLNGKVLVGIDLNSSFNNEEFFDKLYMTLKKECPEFDVDPQDEGISEKYEGIGWWMHPKTKNDHNRPFEHEINPSDDQDYGDKDIMKPEH